MRSTITGCLLALLFFGLTSSCEKRKKARHRLPPPVSVGRVVIKSVPVRIRAIGKVEALTTVSVKSRVMGQLTTVHFKEGRNVTRGDVLFTIDPRPYEATMKQIAANLLRDKALIKQAQATLRKDVILAKNARAEAQRNGALYRKRLIAKDQYEKILANAAALEAVVQVDRAAVTQAEATVIADKAALENARLQLSFCTIRAPITGRTGSLLAHQGDMIKDHDTILVTINQIAPAYVTFSLLAKYLQPLRSRTAAHEEIKVEARAPRQDLPSEHGVISLIDNVIDGQTGTIRLKGRFPNRSKRLWPGEYVEVLLTLRELPRALVVPSQAIQSGQNGQYLFVVKSDTTVELRPVVAGVVEGDVTVVLRGVKVGETVVTDGQMRLVPGAKVTIKPRIAAHNETK